MSPLGLENEAVCCGAALDCIDPQCSTLQARAHSPAPYHTTSFLPVHLLPLTSLFAPLLESHLFSTAPGADTFDPFAKPALEQEPSQPPSSAKSNSPVGKNKGSRQGTIWAGGVGDLSLPVAGRQLQGWPVCAWLLCSCAQSFFALPTAAMDLGCPITSARGSFSPCTRLCPNPATFHSRSRGVWAHHATALAPPYRAVI